MKGVELLGYTLSDSITGFTGVAVGFCSYLGGPDQIQLAPRCASDLTYRGPEWFDERRLLLLPSVPRYAWDSFPTDE